MQFREHLIDDTIKGIYGLAVADMNGDGKKDIIVGSTAEPIVAWYEAPGWERHIVTEKHGGNVSLVAHDLTGNGLGDVIVGSGFNRRVRIPVEYLQWFEAPTDGGPWKSHYIEEIPFLHRVALADINGDGNPLLIAASIRGPEGEFNDWSDPGSVWGYQLPNDPVNDPWERHLIDGQLHLNHGLSIGDVDQDGRLDILIGCRDGAIWLEPPSDPFTGEWRRWVIGERESSEVFAVDLDGDGVNELLSIEPWHGNVLAWYKATGDLRNDPWMRYEIDDTLNRGHSLHALDIDGDGRVEIISGYNGEGTSLQLYRPENLDQNRWTKEIIDNGGLGVGMMDVLDLNDDGRVDIVAGGLSTGNVKWYENLGA
ncbi:MAG: VCBS repeat-containing protein [Candidatus Poribacteria bacterium]|nr:VCBS repeat-containing protein [Candidatus Poribacteria bacterium]